jgi:malate/lactate dehydrogenase
MDKVIENIMSALQCTEEEARDIVAYDKAVDKAKNQADMANLPHALPPDKEKVARQYAKVSTHKKPVIVQDGPRPRKENATKREMVAMIAEIFKDYEDFAVKNPERLVAFKGANGKVYTITLAETRKASVAEV